MLSRLFTSSVDGYRLAETTPTERLVFWGSTAVAKQTGKLLKELAGCCERWVALRLADKPAGRVPITGEASCWDTLASMSSCQRVKKACGSI